LTTTFGTIASVPEGVLVCLSSSFRYLHDGNGAYERGEILGTTRRLLKRLDSSVLSLRRKPQSDGPEMDTLRHYEGFIEWFGTFLLNELDPGNSYPRHILALNTLQLFLKVARRSSTAREPFIMSLLSLIMDPFDDVRSLASLILKEILAFDSDGSTPKMLLEYMQRLEDLSARTCRHDHADAAGRLCASVNSQKCDFGDDTETPVYTHPNLIRRLDTYLKSQQSLEPDSGFPLHAILRGLAYSLDNGADISEFLKPDMITICKRVWTCVQTRLCVDSPETAVEDMEEEDSQGPKDFLAYSWRALRDSRYCKIWVSGIKANFTSLLLQAILRCSGEDIETLSVVGWLCMEQLTLLRHRGAFSTVAQTFNICCEKARSATELQIQKLNDNWYKVCASDSHPPRLLMFSLLGCSSRDREAIDEADETLSWFTGHALCRAQSERF
jgi:Putative death-receptor fusion protein (DUF2428)